MNLQRNHHKEKNDDTSKSKQEHQMELLKKNPKSQVKKQRFEQKTITSSRELIQDYREKNRQCITKWERELKLKTL